MDVDKILKKKKECIVETSPSVLHKYFVLNNNMYYCILFKLLRIYCITLLILCDFLFLDFMWPLGTLPDGEYDYYFFNKLTKHIRVFFKLWSCVCIIVSLLSSFYT